MTPQSIEKEVWKPVKGYEGIYSVSNYGKIRNNDTGRILKPYVNPHDYPRIELSNSGIRLRYFVHRLVARAFIGDLPLGLQVNHIDGNKENNFYKNLEYVTPKRNMQHAIENNLRLEYASHITRKRMSRSAKELWKTRIRNHTLVTCKNDKCKIVFRSFPAKLKVGLDKYCSRKCYFDVRYPYRLSNS